MNKAQTFKTSGLVNANGDAGVFDNDSFSSGVFIIKNTAGAGTSPTLTVTVEGVCPETGATWTILATTAIAGATPATTILKIGPGLPVTANASANDILPKQFRVKWAIGGSAGPSVTFSIAASLNK